MILFGQHLSLSQDEGLASSFQGSERATATLPSHVAGCEKRSHAEVGERRRAPRLEQVFYRFIYAAGSMFVGSLQKTKTYPNKGDLPANGQGSVIPSLPSCQVASSSEP